MNTALRRIIAILMSVAIVISLLAVGFSVTADSGEPQNITITFAINNSIYTNDPGSGYTHLTSPTVITGGDLSYSSWAGTYQVTGTGTVCGYSIPSGTSLADNSLSEPNLSVTNITDTNTYSYSSIRSWVTADGMVCSRNTVFDEDTTLYLSLYLTDEDYSVDFVCCEEHQTSFNYYCGGGSCFKLGESLSADHFYDYDTVNEHFPSTNHDVTEFAGWQLKITATDEYVPFSPGMPITVAYTDSTNYGNAVKAYAIWEEPAATVTATFLNDTTLVETRPLTSGDVLGTLPDLSEDAPEGQAFLGWQYTDENDSLVYATDTTVITADTTYYAVFGDDGYVNVIFHDILPDGTESMSIDVSVQTGTSLSDIEDAALEDGIMISECIWNTVAEGVNTPIDFNDYTVTESVDLYTYSYDLILMLNPTGLNSGVVLLSAVDVTTGSGDSLTLTITARQGEPLTSADFIVNGVDLSRYLWTYVDDLGVTQTLDIPSIVANGLTESIVATSTGVLNITGATPNPNHQVNFYIFIDDQRVLLKSQSVTSYVINNRRYLSAATLAAVYGDYGFDGDDLTVGTRYFPHTDVGRPNIWADTSVTVLSGCAFSPITSHSQPVDVYYLPHQTLGSTNAAWQTILNGKTESFYSTQVVDVGEYVYLTDDLPEPVYTLTGDTATITVSNSPRVLGTPIRLVCTGVNNGVGITGTDNGDGTTTFVIPDINQPYRITIEPDNDSTTIGYSINLPETPIDPEYGQPTIEGESSYTVVVDKDTTSHMVLAPNLSYYLFSASEKYLGRATFLGWAVNGDTNPANLVQPGDVLDLEDYGSIVNLVAQWHTDHADRQDKTGPMVNFYVSLAAHPDKDDHWTGNIESAMFTDSVYTDDCGVPAGIIPTKGLYINQITSPATQYFVLGSTSSTIDDTITTRHQMIVEELTRGHTMVGNDDLEYTFQTSFPSDALVMRNIRDMIINGAHNGNPVNIVVNGHTVTPEEMNAENFSVRWYVFKYDISDGWHIDGVLVSKIGTMVVNKTFDGDESLIQSIKNGDYSIDVTTTEGAVFTGGTLSLDNAEHYNPITDTYTWEVEVEQFYDYTLTENNYIATQDNCLTYAEYDVHNSRHGGNTHVWQNYQSSGVTVTGQSNYDNDIRKLTVDFMNTYTQPGTILFKKNDGYSGHGIEGISFEVADSLGPLPLFDRGNGYYSVIPSNDPEEEITAITTNHNGQAFLTLTPGTYYFTEQVPEGYESPGVITVEVGVDPDTNKMVINSVNASGGSQYVSVDSNSLELNIKNYSETTDLTVEKIWLGDVIEPITFQLYINREPYGDIVAFDGIVDDIETEPWKYVYTDIPIYVDGQPAEYFFHEVSIGSFMYSPDFPDGYQYYSVTSYPITYLDALGNPTDNVEDIASAYLYVTNRRGHDDLAITKVDENGAPLPGAVFKLYSGGSSANILPENPFNEDNLVTTVSSGTDGIANFSGVFDGIYYLAEYMPPSGYAATDDVYRIRTSNGIVALERWDAVNSTWIHEPYFMIQNSKNTVRIRKQVTGQMGDLRMDFNFTVTSTERMMPGEGYALSADGLTATFSLKHGEEITLIGVPVGSQLTVTETNAQGYEMSVTVGGIVASGAITVGNHSDIVVVNRKGSVPDIGVLLDTLPYVLIMAVVVVGTVFIIIRRHRNRDDD